MQINHRALILELSFSPSMQNHKARLYPNKSQKRELFRQFAVHCELYNYCLTEKIETYEKTGKSPSCFDQIKANVPKFKNNCNVASMQQTVRRLDKTFGSFFRRVKKGEKPGFPRYKKTFKSLDFRKGDGAKIIGSRLRIQNVGSIKMVNHRNVVDYTRVTIKYEHGDWYAIFSVESVPVTYEPSDKAIGIDFGLQTFAATSDGVKYFSPKPLRENIKALTKAQSKRDKAPKGSEERRQRNKALRYLHRYINNVRKDWNHKLSRKLVKENGTIVIENLSLKDLQSEISNINRAYRDVAWGEFVSMLDYKAENAGRLVFKVNPAYTSQTCQCGAITPHTLKERTFLCGQCGGTADRDVNAARNILALGLQGRPLKLVKPVSGARSP